MLLLVLQYVTFPKFKFIKCSEFILNIKKFNDSLIATSE